MPANGAKIGRNDTAQPASNDSNMLRNH
ncbi:hypothetical protein AZE42_10793 [Rhizopogon vesiculosus]|uniref:Uncharacterized protein n=1 Tax=Rhizopogon vesiculosus TaxID=180088 RepID=A0A1J8QL05_9AGAM|nr:hypothetical protein AZE42_10793 [Rhizopogon vesiculosus]